MFVPPNSCPRCRNNAIWVTNTAAGQVYEGSVFVNPSAAGETVSLVVRETTPGGSSVGEHVTTITTASGWQQITSTYTAKNSGDYIRYSVYASNFASSSQNFLDRISTETLLIHAQDDPFVPATPYFEQAWSKMPKLTALLPKSGGHLGFHDPLGVWHLRQIELFFNQV